MIQSKRKQWVWVVLVGLLLIGCQSDVNEVATLRTPDAAYVEAAADVATVPLSDEERMMAFTACMRDQDIELVDAGVDAEGNVQRPVLAEGAQVSREEYGEAMEICGKHLEGLTVGTERQDVTDALDQHVALATCLREKGYDVDDPTAETLDQWGQDFRVEFEWDDPEAVADYEACDED
jgi:hypothetical protein